MLSVSTARVLSVEKGGLRFGKIDEHFQFLFEDCGDLRRGGVGCNGHSHGDDAAAQRLGHDAEEGATAIPVGHGAHIVDGQGGVIRKEFDIKRVSAFGDVETGVMRSLDFVGEERRPARKQKRICQGAIEDLRINIGFDGSGYGLRRHGRWMKRGLCVMQEETCWIASAVVRLSRA
jgi:hypothetical protein